MIPVLVNRKGDIRVGPFIRLNTGSPSSTGSRTAPSRRSVWEIDGWGLEGPYLEWIGGGNMLRARIASGFSVPDGSFLIVLGRNRDPWLIRMDGNFNPVEARHLSSSADRTPADAERLVFGPDGFMFGRYLVRIRDGAIHDGHEVPGPDHRDLRDMLNGGMRAVLLPGAILLLENGLAYDRMRMEWGKWFSPDAVLGAAVGILRGRRGWVGRVTSVIHGGEARMIPAGCTARGLYFLLRYAEEAGDRTGMAIVSVGISGDPRRALTRPDLRVWRMEELAPECAALGRPASVRIHGYPMGGFGIEMRWTGAGGRGGGGSSGPGAARLLLLHPGSVHGRAADDVFGWFSVEEGESVVRWFPGLIGYSCCGAYVPAVVRYFGEEAWATVHLPVRKGASAGEMCSDGCPDDRFIMIGPAGSPVRKIPHFSEMTSWDLVDGGRFLIFVREGIAYGCPVSALESGVHAWSAVSIGQMEDVAWTP